MILLIPILWSAEEQIEMTSFHHVFVKKKKAYFANFWCGKAWNTFLNSTIGY